MRFLVWKEHVRTVLVLTGPLAVPAAFMFLFLFSGCLCVFCFSACLRLALSRASSISYVFVDNLKYGCSYIKVLVDNLRPVDRYKPTRVGVDSCERRFCR